MWAWQQLMVDGALANVSVHIAGGDEGASNIIANGIANLSLNHSSPFTLIVGGTSIAGLYSALSDSTLTQMVTLAQNDDPGTVFQLVASGLRTLPSNLSAAEPKPSILQALFETVWQTLSVAPSTINGQPVLQSDYGAHKTGSGWSGTDDCDSALPKGVRDILRLQSRIWERPGERPTAAVLSQTAVQRRRPRHSHGRCRRDRALRPGTAS